eukprot:3760092-Pyramimonas_sp.AAC.1
MLLDGPRRRKNAHVRAMPSLVRTGGVSTQRAQDAEGWHRLGGGLPARRPDAVSYTHLRAHETGAYH